MSERSNRLHPITQAEHTAARLREMARELLNQAAALEAGINKPRSKNRQGTQMLSMEEICKMVRRN